MTHLQNYAEQLGGFDFSLSQRNKLLEDNKAIKALSYKKTGTTIVGVKFADGVVLAADTRATGGSIVVEKNCEKIHYVAPNIYACGAGTAADTQFVNLFQSSNLELQRLNSGRQTRVSSYITSTASMLYRYQGNLGAYLIVGGYDVLGSHLVMLSAEGK
jgi:20S proteasome subunit beta 2